MNCFCLLYSTVLPHVAISVVYAYNADAISSALCYDTGIVLLCVIVKRSDTMWSFDHLRYDTLTNTEATEVY